MSDTEETTEVEETPAETTEESAPELTLAEQHVAFKQKASEVLWTYGERRGWCTMFDEILERAGLQGRAVVDHYPRRQITLVGEETTEEFEAWRVEASRTLHSQATRYGIDREEYEPYLVEAGLMTYADLYREVTAVIEGTFRFTRTVELPAGTSLIDVVPSYTVSYWLRDEFDGPNVQWKATVEGADGQPEDAPVDETGKGTE